MPEAPQLAPLNVEEQQLYFNPVSKAEPSYPVKETHYHHLHLQSHSFIHDLELVIMDDESWDIECLVN